MPLLKNSFKYSTDFYCCFLSSSSYFVPLTLVSAVVIVMESCLGPLYETCALLSTPSHSHPYKHSHQIKACQHHFIAGCGFSFLFLFFSGCFLTLNKCSISGEVIFQLHTVSFQGELRPQQRSRSYTEAPWSSPVH